MAPLGLMPALFSRFLNHFSLFINPIQTPPHLHSSPKGIQLLQQINSQSPLNDRISLKAYMYMIICSYKEVSIWLSLLFDSRHGYCFCRVFDRIICIWKPTGDNRCVLALTMNMKT